MILRLTWLLICALPLLCFSQVRLMSYNLLNFPTGNIQGRVDTLYKIANYVRPNLLMVQELENEDGLEQITDMLNDLGYGDFAHAEFVPQQSPGSPLNPLQQSLIYDQEQLILIDEGVVLTSYRDINEYHLILNDPLLGEGADTVDFYVFVTHLKSSTGAENEVLRLEMVNALIERFDELPSESRVIFCGDFNLYTNQEPAYMAITDENISIPMVDVFASYGDWPGAGFSHKEILTQCTRVSPILDDGAGGGVDDRFDFILFSESLMEPGAPLYFQEDSYKSLGNTGECYNQDILDCSSGNEVPYDVLRAMFYMSDHIPQVCNLHSDLFSSNAELHDFNTTMKIWYDKVSSQLNIIYPEQSYYHIDIYDLAGQKIFSQVSSSTIGIPFISDGIYIVTVSGNGHFTRQPVFVN